MYHVKSTEHYQADMVAQADASLQDLLAPFVSCSSSGCQISSWSAAGGGFKIKFDHDHPSHTRGTAVTQNSPK